MRMDTDGAVVGRRRRQRLRRRPRSPACCADYGDERFATPDRPGDRGVPPDRVDGRPGGHRHEAIPAAARRRGGHPAKRTFQAIRVEVNAELEQLPTAIDAAIDATAPGGRIAVLSYHSGEDRIVKERFRRATGACECPPGLPCVCGAVQTVRLVRAPRRPSAGRAGGQPPRRLGAPARRRAAPSPTSGGGADGSLPVRRPTPPADRTARRSTSRAERRTARHVADSRRPRRRRAPRTSASSRARGPPSTPPRCSSAWSSH